MTVPKPDYLSRDYEGLRTSLLQYAAQAFPEWQPSSEGDFGMVMVELFSYMGDILSYYTDRAQMENYLGTATQRDSVLGLAYLLGYVPTSGTPARGTVTFRTDASQGDTTLPAGTVISTGRIAALDAPVKFETEADAVILGAAAVTSPVAVVEGETVNYVKIGESTGRATQVYALPHTGVYTDTVRLFVEDSTGSIEINPGSVSAAKVREWVREEHLLDADDDDPVFETYFDNSTTSVIFGDDINGAIPATGLQIFATYRHGVGALGNVAVGQVRLLSDTGVGGVHVNRDAQGAYESTVMSGGSDSESTISVRYNAPRAYRTQGRVVTTQDYTDLALGIEGVSKANVVVGTFTSVTIYITGADGLAPSETLKTVVAERFADKTLAGVTVTVSSPTLVRVDITAAVTLFSRYSQKAVKAAILKKIDAYVKSLAFGEKMTVGRIYDLIINTDGVGYVDISKMARAGGSGVVTITPRVWEIFSNDAPGVKSITMSGGVA